MYANHKHKKSKYVTKKEDFFAYCYAQPNSDFTCFDPFNNSSKYATLKNCGDDFLYGDFQISFIVFKKQSNCTNLIGDIITNTQDLSNYSLSTIKEEFKKVINSTFKEVDLPCDYDSKLKE